MNALFPMVKAAIRGLDTIEDYVSSQFNFNLSGFIVSGGSKRGWTTWLTCAVDRALPTSYGTFTILREKLIGLRYEIRQLF